MKRFLLKLGILIILIAIIDFLAGKAFSALYANSKGGNTWRNNYICNHTTEDVLVFGSSRAIHHYNPAIIEKETGMSCYNCGQDGNGIIMNYGRLKMILSRYTPKLIIYDVTPSFDILAKDDNHKYLSWLNPFYDKPEVQEIFLHVDEMEKIKMMSYLYRNNSSFLMTLMDNLAPQKSAGIKGYRPLTGLIDRSKVLSPNENQYIEDTLKIAMIDAFISKIDKSTKLVFVYSPIWYGSNKSEKIEIITDLCSKHGVTFLDYSNSKDYIHNDRFFKDGGHLNSNGADIFTAELIKEFRMKYLD